MTCSPFRGKLPWFCFPVGSCGQLENGTQILFASALRGAVKVALASKIRSLGNAAALAAKPRKFIQDGRCKAISPHSAEGDPVAGTSANSVVP